MIENCLIIPAQAQNSANLHCIHTKKLSCLKSCVEFDMNDILYEIKNLHYFKDSLTFGVKAVLTSLFCTGFAVPRKLLAIIQSGHLCYLNPTSNKGTDHPISQKQFHYNICLKIIALYHKAAVIDHATQNT